jgi:hypothetical protein
VSKRAAYDALVEQGCLCGTDEVARCPIHTEPRDYRGIRAFFAAGMPNGFPMQSTCSICRSEGLMYPSVELDRGEVPAGRAPGPTLICPNCSVPVLEERLVAQCEAAGYELNEQRVFVQIGREAA